MRDYDNDGHGNYDCDADCDCDNDGGQVEWRNTKSGERESWAEFARKNSGPLSATLLISK